MHEMKNLKNMLMRELEEISYKGELSAGSLETVDKLANSLKNVCKIIEYSDMEDEGYSGNDGRSYRNAYSRESYEGRGGRNSYARGRNARRDSMGRYSRDGGDDDMVSKLYEMMENAPDEKTRMEFKRMIDKME